tara:strand:- start:4899 stop:5033 length:135 start_codon:yes stop_codon:yes gene_type:complete
VTNHTTEGISKQEQTHTLGFKSLCLLVYLFDKFFHLDQFALEDL